MESSLHHDLLSVDARGQESLSHVTLATLPLGCGRCQGAGVLVWFQLPIRRRSCSRLELVELNGGPTLETNPAFSVERRS